LYRGGNVLLSFLASTILFFLSIHWTSLIGWAILGLILCAVLLRQIPLRIRRLLMYVALAGVLLGDCRLLLTWPAIGRSILFEADVPPDPTPYLVVFRSFAGLVLLWILLAYGGRDVASEPFLIEPRSIRRFAGTFAVLHLLALPVMYGAFQYPWTYPMAEVHTSEKAPVSIAKTLAAGNVAFLFDTKDDLVLFGRLPGPTVLRLRKEAVTGLVFRKYVDLLDRGWCH
jgi:hypothetical protein